MRSTVAKTEWSTIERALQMYARHSGVSIYMLFTAQRVKIGQTCHSVGARKRQIELAVGAPLILMASCSASPQLERALHRHYATHALGNEWFVLQPSMHRLARALNALGARSGLGPWVVDGEARRVAARVRPALLPA